MLSTNASYSVTDPIYCTTSSGNRSGKACNICVYCPCTKGSWVCYTERTYERTYALGNLQGCKVFTLLDFYIESSSN